MGKTEIEHRHLLPPVMATILDLAGEDAMIAIVQEHGGTRVVIPVHADRDNWLTRIVGPEEAAAIIDHFGAAIPIDVPNGRAWFRARAIDEHEKQGLSAPEMARSFGVTDRTIRMWRAIRRGGPKKAAAARRKSKVKYAGSHRTLGR